LAGNLIASNVTIRPTAVEGGAIAGPGEGETRGGVLSDLLDAGEEIGGVFVDLRDGELRLQVPDLDGFVGGSAEPVSVGGEAKSIDDISSLKRVQVLALGQVPKHGNTVLSTGGAKRTIRRDRDGVQVAGVAHEIGHQLAVGEIPHLNNLIPSARNDDGVGSVGREAHTGDPLGVTLVLNSEFTFTQSVPKLDSSITTTTDNLSVISRESDRKNILGVSNKSSGGSSVVDIPQTEGTIPRTRKSELAIRRDDHILNKVRVTS